VRSDTPGGAIGTNDTNGKASGETSEADRLLHLAAAGAAALAEPDPGLDEERAVIAEVRAAEATGALPVKPEADHRRHLAGLERAAFMRPPSWADPALRCRRGEPIAAAAPAIGPRPGGGGGRRRDRERMGLA
jgi:hypothetical protein